MPIRVAIIDGDTLTRYGLRELVSQHPDIEIAAECGSAARAPAMVDALRPDVVTVDTALPDGDGLRLARELRDRQGSLGIVMLTSNGEDDVLFRALETGVSAFVAKTAPVEEVLAAIRHAAVAASSFTAAGLANALARRRAVEERLALSPRERETLRLLRDGMSIPAIARALFISHSTAKTYVARLYRKLGAANRTQALITAMHFGLIRYEQPEPQAGAHRPLPAVAPAGACIAATHAPPARGASVPRVTTRRSVGVAHAARRTALLPRPALRRPGVTASGPTGRRRNEFHPPGRFAGCPGVSVRDARLSWGAPCRSVSPSPTATLSPATACVSWWRGNRTWNLSRSARRPLMRRA